MKGRFNHPGKWRSNLRLPSLHLIFDISIAISLSNTSLHWRFLYGERIYRRSSNLSHVASTLKPFDNEVLLRGERRKAHILRGELCSFLQCVQTSAEKYSGIRFVKEFNTGLMNS